MPPLVAAAADRTGLTITLLSIGLLAIAVSLAVLTVWYWRFTRPGRTTLDRATPDRTTVDRVAPGRPIRLTEPSPPGRTAAAIPNPSTPPLLAAAVVIDEAGAVDEVVVGNEVVAEDGEVVAEDGGSEAALDDDQWAVLTQVVFEHFLEPPEAEEGAPSGNAAGSDRG